MPGHLFGNVGPTRMRRCGSSLWSFAAGEILHVRKLQNRAMISMRLLGNDPDTSGPHHSLTAD